MTSLEIAKFGDFMEKEIQYREEKNVKVENIIIVTIFLFYATFCIKLAVNMINTEINRKYVIVLSFYRKIKS